MNINFLLAQTADTLISPQINEFMVRNQLSQIIILSANTHPGPYTNTF